MSEGCVLDGHAVAEIPLSADMEPAEGVTASQTVTVSTGPTSPGWLSTNLRNFIALALCVTVCYLAYIGIEQARTALVNGFMLLIGAIWGERAALKQPGKDS